MFNDSEKDGIPMLMGVEQGSRKYQNSTCVCFKPNMAIETKNCNIYYCKKERMIHIIAKNEQIRGIMQE